MNGTTAIRVRRVQVPFAVLAFSVQQGESGRTFPKLCVTHWRMLGGGEEGGRGAGGGGG